MVILNVKPHFSITIFYRYFGYYLPKKQFFLQTRLDSVHFRVCLRFLGGEPLLVLTARVIRSKEISPVTCFKFMGGGGKYCPFITAWHNVLHTLTNLGVISHTSVGCFFFFLRKYNMATKVWTSKWHLVFAGVERLFRFNLDMSVLSF